MNLYKVVVSFHEPVISEVAILARDEQHALERLAEATDYQNAPKEYNFNILSVELAEEDVAVSQEEVEEAYENVKRPERILN